MLGLMAPDKNKSMATTIVDRLNGETEGGPDLDASVGKKAAMSKFINAMHAKDVDGAHSALSDYLDMHESEQGDSDDAIEYQGGVG